MKTPEKNWLEWIVFAISLLLVAGATGYLGYDAMTLGDRPPNPVVQLGEPQQQGEFFVVPLSVSNQGDRTAGTVQVEVWLENNGQEVERARWETAFLPRQSKREGWVRFSNDPRRAGSLRTRVVSYEKQ